jgi:hypothetical protein
MHTYQTNVEMKKVSPITAVEDCFSQNNFNMHIDGCAHAFHLNQPSNEIQSKSPFIPHQPLHFSHLPFEQ